MALAGIAFLATALTPPSAIAAELPRLVLQITVDQLRYDLVQRYANGYTADGFRYLWENGAVYANAHHRHANTETIVGHTTLATGTDPAVHGMVGNIWFDRKSDAVHYNIQDARYPLLSAGGGVDQDTELDPTQRAATTDGRSPAAIITSTISDELALHFGPASKIFGVSVKDRGAISMAGHAGKALWFSKADGGFVSSSYYFDALPGWVEDWNAGDKVESFAETEWTLLLDPSRYRFADRDNQPWEVDFSGFGRTFPHAFGSAKDKYFTTFLTMSPAGDAITLDFAKAVVEAEDLGADDTPDYLAISFSSTDYVGHMFGPSSLEAEDNMKRLDRVLGDLFMFIDDKVGLDRTLIVLSADHGATEAPGYLATLGIEASIFDFGEINKEPAIEALTREFGLAEELIASFTHPYIFLDNEVIESAGLDKSVVERRVAEELTKIPGIAFAVGSSALRSGSLPQTPLTAQVRANFHADRSGDIYVVLEPHWFVGDFDGLTVATAHGSPWRYDTHVPIVFVGAGIEPALIHRQVETVDVAPTIAAYLGTKPPSGALGVPLVEVVD
ncbi:MAG: alkaline phosphatase family protein [Rhodobacteraceae bacterium]|nr:alkaline phosphatase family protein [Paracoccaceae bacterium]